MPKENLFCTITFDSKPRIVEDNVLSDNIFAHGFFYSFYFRFFIKYNNF